MRPIPEKQVLALIHEFEQGPHGGVALTAYKDSGGLPTIGWGHLILPTEKHLLTATITPEEADATALADLAIAARGVEANIGSAITTITDNQYAALIDFVFNEGEGHFATSTLCRLVRQQAFHEAAAEFPKWCYGLVDGVHTQLPGLVRRRAAEKALWESP